MTQTFPLTIVSPAARVLDAPVELVEIPGSEGEFGVLSGHMPLIAMLKAGVIRVHREGEATKRFFTAAGYADVSNEGCTILSDRIQDLDTVDAGIAREALAEADRALEAASGDEAWAKAEKIQQAAAALVSALEQ